MVDTVRHPHTWVPTAELYAYISDHTSGYALQTYRRPHAKSYFTKEYQWTDRQRDKITNELMRPDIFLQGYKLYKLGQNGLWHCIFEPDSEAGFEFIKGNITVREFRDSIPWEQTF